MPSLIIELQQETLNPTSSVPHLLRLALTIACKLKLTDLKTWVEDELNGYQEEAKVPPYRHVHGIVKYLNPYHGWRPVTFECPQEHDIFSKRTLCQPIGELEELVQGKQGGVLTIYFPPEQEHFMQNGLHSRAKVALFASPSQIHGILDAVRNNILNHALKLEELGILGENMTFSNEEKKRSVEKMGGSTYHIHNETVIHSPQGPLQIQQNSNGSAQTISGISEEALATFIEKIQSGLKSLALNAEQEKDLRAHIATIEAQKQASTPQTPIIKAALRSIQTVLEGIATSALGSLLIDALKKLT